MNKLSLYLSRKEFRDISNWHKELLSRYVRRFRGDYPVGRTLALACLRFNSRYNQPRISESFINWLYYY